MTQVQDATKSIDAEIATLMSTDVDAAGLLNRFRVALPASMSVTSVAVTVTAVPGNPAGATSSTPSLDTSGRQQIGTVSLSGKSQNLSDLATYVRTLTAMPGVVNVVPSSNTSSAGGTQSARGAQWTVTLQITDQLYTHRYDATTTPGGK